MSTGPAFVNDPIELLTFDPTREAPFINKHWSASLCGVVVFMSVCFGNYATRVPALSGIQRHILYTGVGAYVGHVIEHYRTNYLAERDAVLRHYIELHPEDFPLEERLTFAGAFLPWVPIR